MRISRSDFLRVLYILLENEDTHIFEVYYKHKRLFDFDTITKTKCIMFKNIKRIIKDNMSRYVLKIKDNNNIYTYLFNITDYIYVACYIENI